MPANSIIDLGYGNLPQVQQDSKALYAAIKEVLDVARELDGFKINISDWNAGIKDFKTNSAAAAKTNNDLATSMNNVNTAIINQAKVRKANADAMKAEVNADTAVINQITAEAQAEKKLADAKIATAKASKTKQQVQTEVVPTVIGEGDQQGNTTGTTVSDEEQAYARATSEAYAFSEAQKQVAVETKSADQIIIESTGLLDEYVGSLHANINAQIENEAAIATNRAQQKELVAAGAASAAATEEQRIQLIGLRQTELELVETNKNLSTTVRNQIKDFISVEGSTDALRARLNALTRQYDQLSLAEKTSQFGINLKKEIDTTLPAVKAAEQELGKFQRNVGNYSNGITKAFSGAFSYLRQIAYILPGIGIAGIFNALFTLIGKVAEKMDLFGQKTSIVNQVITGTDDNSQRLRDSLNLLGSSAEEIAENAFKKLDEALEQVRKELGETPDAVDTAKGAIRLLEDELDKLNEKYKEAVKNEQDAIGGGLNFGAASQNAAVIKDVKDRMDDVNKEIEKGNSKLTELQIEQRRVALLGQGEVNRQFLEDNIKLNQAANEKIISDEKKSFGERLSALADNLDQTLQFNRIEKEKEILYAGEDEKKKNSALEKYRYENLKAQADYNQKLLDLNRKASEQDFKQFSESLKAQIDALQHIVNNDDLNNYSTFAQRQDAAQKIHDLQVKLSDAIRDHDIANGKSVATAQKESSNRIVDIVNQMYNNLHKIQVEKGKFAEEILPKPEDVQRAAAPLIDSFKFINDAILNRLKDVTENQTNIFTTAFQQEAYELAEQYNKGIISRQAYEKGLADLTKKYTKESLQYAIDEAEKRLPLLNKETDEYKNLAKAIADAKVALNDKKGSAGFLDNIDKYAEAATRLADAFSAIAGISFARQKAQLEELGAQEEKNYEREQTNIQNSILSNQEKADQLKILDSQHAANQEEIARKQREADNKKAEFDKATAVMNIIAGTAVAVVKALDVPFLAAAIAIAGAAQLAAVIATPVPHYFAGTTSAKEGWALTDELGAELRVDPSGEMHYGNDQPTYRWLSAGTKIIPHDEVNDFLYNIMLQNTGRSIELKEKKEKFDYNRFASVLAKEMKNNKRPVVKVINKLGDDFMRQRYIDRNVKGNW